MRINKYLAACGVCSRRGADKLIEEKRVRIGDRVAKLGDEVTDETVYLDGEPVSDEEIKSDRVIIAFNKPPGYICSASDEQGKSIFELIDYPRRLFYMGRLDVSSRGLLLLSNDGDLANNLMHSSNLHEREYEVTVDREVTREFADKLSRGVYLNELGVRTRPCKVTILSRNRFSIVLTQGLNRQIRRMCMELGTRVQDLCRVRIENIKLGRLNEGTYRKLSDTEKQSLMTLVSEGKNANKNSK